MPESLFNKAAGLRPATLLKKRLWHRCFPVNFAKFLGTPLSYRTPSAAASALSQALTNHVRAYVKYLKL